MSKRCKDCGCADCFPNKGEKGATGNPGPQGEIGLQGPPGAAVNVVGENDIVVEESIVLGVQTFTVGRPKEFFYQQVVTNNDISLDPSFVSMQYFAPTGYSILTYTNASLVAKTYKVHASYEHSVGVNSANSPAFESWVDAALVKTVGITNTVEYESLGQLNLSGYLFWGLGTNEIIGSGSPVHNLLDDQGAAVSFRFLQSQLPMRASFFKPVTLNPGEKITLMFKTKNPTPEGAPASALLKKAQIMVEEL